MRSRQLLFDARVSDIIQGWKDRYPAGGTRLEFTEPLPDVFKTLIAVTEDQLVPLADMRQLADRLPNARLRVVDSIFGHDAFLKERELLLDLFSEALQSPCPDA